MTQALLHEPHLTEVVARHPVNGTPALRRITAAGSIDAPYAVICSGTAAGC